MKKICVCLLVLLLILQAAPIAVVTHASEVQPAAEEIPQCHSVDELALYLREAMKLRQETVQIELVTDNYYEGILAEALEKAYQHTGVPTEGDYLRWQYGGWEGAVDGYSKKGMYYLTLTYQITYYTTAAQEQQVDAKVEQLLAQWDWEEMSDYDKIRTVYNWICNHVVYDDEHLSDDKYFLKHTAYAALEHGTSVCQGYVLVLYRLFLEMGIDNRIIFGTSQNQDHAWNIVKLNGKYYDLDATWDAIRHQDGSAYRYFLCCQSNFENHDRDSSQDTPQFHIEYPMADENYGVVGHDYVQNVVAPTCTENGYTVHTCKICEYSYTGNTLKATGHLWDAGEVTKEPTEKETGLRVQTCIKCQETKETVLPKKEHKHNYSVKVTNPTCTQQGYTTHTCACGDSYTDSYTNPAGHKWDKGIVTKEPTEKETGLRVQTCDICKDTKQTVVPVLSHTHNHTSVVTAPTCTQQGYTTHTCSCGDSYTDTYAEPVDHSFADGSCSVCGRKDPTAETAPTQPPITEPAPSEPTPTEPLPAEQGLVGCVVGAVIAGMVALPG